MQNIFNAHYLNSLNPDFFDNIQKIGNLYSQILTELIQKNSNFQQNNQKIAELQINYISNQLNKITNSIVTSPELIADKITTYNNNVMNLINYSIMNYTGFKQDPLYTSKDRRFKHESWDSHPYYDFLKQYYIMHNEWSEQFIDDLELDNNTKLFAKFLFHQIMDAFAPTNFISTNPEAFEKTIATNGQNIIDGLTNALTDLKNSAGTLNISTADKTSFEIGKNIATTPGKIIYQNDLMQLICYEPKSKTHTTPIFILPPWINKYYILDLTKEKSFVNWLVEQNYQVFLVSWINPDQSHNYITFDDYLKLGVVEPLEYLIKNFKYKSFNAIGYCIGGTLLASAASYFQKKNKNYFNNLTFLTTLLDFSDPGELGMFINNETMPLINAQMDEAGYFAGIDMNSTFSTLRANDMIWSFFVNNYLLGNQPLPFDILYWNADSTNLPAKMHKFYLENTYLNNKLCQADQVSLLDTKIDLSKIDVPNFFLATKDDHIVPWQASFNGAKLLKGKTEFCLAGSGHVAGVVNPPSKKKYYHYIGNSKLEQTDSWLENAKKHDGSWWEHWHKWNKQLAGELIKAVDYKNLQAIELAPGSYVKKKLI